MGEASPGARARIGIVGAGAMGTLFAYMLARNNDVTILDVRGEAIEAIVSNGVAVDDEPPRAVRATRDPSQLFGVTHLFFFVKATDTLAAVRPFTAQLNPAAPIVSLQNGLGNEEAIKAALGGAVPLVLGITSEGCVTLGHGRSRRSGAGTTVLGSAGASVATAHGVAALLQDAGLPARVVYDIRPHLWGKLLANAAINPVAALLDRKNGAILADVAAADLARALAVEAAAVAKALRINLPFSSSWDYVREVIEASAEAWNSMTVDLSAHRHTEVDRINGAIVAAGRRAGVATPYNESMLWLIKAKERLGED